MRAERVEVAPGAGLLARRADAVAFVAGHSPAAAGWAPALDAFVGAPDRESALAGLLDHAVDHHLEVGPFAVVTWDTAVHLVVFGDLTLVTDLSSVPRLSGAGMPTWVEHRATRTGERAEVRLGDAPSAGTDLRDGIVAAGGFRLLLTTDAAVTEPPAPAPAPPPPEHAPPPPPAPAATPPATTPPTPTAAPPLPAPPGGASWDVLRDAGGAWMDDSLQLSEPRRTPPAAPEPPTLQAPLAPAPEAVTGSEPFDPEITLDAGGLVMPPTPSSPDAPAPLARYVQARHCDAGHLNPPLRTHCRVCDRYIPPATPVETVPQPVLATLVLGDGRTVDVNGPVVLGRTPSADAARLDEAATLVAVAEPTVSRTHAVVTVDGWTLLAVDCAATGGTAIARSGGEPTVLEPWLPHELAVGDTLFLGGPTQVQVVARPE